MVNKVILIGRVGRDPEIRSTQSGVKVANFSVATNRVWFNKDTKEKNEETEWHNIVAWSHNAETAEKYIGKGQLLYVEGRLQTRSWEDKNSGEKKYRTEIVADRLWMLGRNEQEQASKPKGDPDFPDFEDDDIPFSWLVVVPFVGMLVRMMM